MAMARQRAEWQRAANLNAWAINCNGMQKSPIDPVRMIPPQFRPAPAPPRVRSPEEIAEENRLGWVALDRFFGGK